MAKDKRLFITIPTWIAGKKRRKVYCKLQYDINYFPIYGLILESYIKRKIKKEKKTKIIFMTPYEVKIDLLDSNRFEMLMMTTIK